MRDLSKSAVFCIRSAIQMCLSVLHCRLVYFYASLPIIHNYCTALQLDYPGYSQWNSLEPSAVFNDCHEWSGLVHKGNVNIQTHERKLCQIVCVCVCMCMHVCMHVCVNVCVQQTLSTHIMVNRVHTVIW